MRGTEKKLSYLLPLIAAFALVIAAFHPLRAQAASRTVKTLKSSAKLTAVTKKATKVTRGTTTLKVGEGYLKFTAPSTKIWTFTFSDLHTVGGNASRDINNGHATFYTIAGKTRKYLKTVQGKTQGGKTAYIDLCTAYHYSLGAPAKVTRFTYLPSRSAKLKLRKGQTVYIRLYFVNKPSTLKLKIK